MNFSAKRSETRIGRFSFGFMVSHASAIILATQFSTKSSMQPSDTPAGDSNGVSQGSSNVTFSKSNAS